MTRQKHKNIKVRRVIEYEGAEPDVVAHLASAFLSPETPDRHDGVGRNVAVRLIAETERSGPTGVWRTRPRPASATA